MFMSIVSTTCSHYIEIAAKSLFYGHLKLRQAFPTIREWPKKENKDPHQVMKTKWKKKSQPKQNIRWMWCPSSQVQLEIGAYHEEWGCEHRLFYLTAREATFCNYKLFRFPTKFLFHHLVQQIFFVKNEKKN